MDNIPEELRKEWEIFQVMHFYHWISEKELQNGTEPIVLYGNNSRLFNAKITVSNREEC